MEEMNDIIEINLLGLFEYLKNRFGKIIISILVCMIISVITIFLISEKYTSIVHTFSKMDISTESGTVTDPTSISVNTSMINNYFELIGGYTII
ncbi:MAG: Wzz/FepE/Etk N-terminal domain-containing protein [Erysipelotrichaceae bacterium]|nr:Wzz/FepE/Etk N-terminal domain-containing protein [Erysipelotrichaceae bacterium]